MNGYRRRRRPDGPGSGLPSYRRARRGSASSRLPLELLVPRPGYVEALSWLDLGALLLEGFEVVEAEVLHFAALPSNIDLDGEADFIVTQNYHIRLRPAAALIERPSANRNRKVSGGGRNYSFETLVQEVSRRRARHLITPKTPLDLSCPCATDKGGYLGSNLKARVGSMSYPEARKGGISKAGLRDTNKRVAERKPLRLYRKVVRRLTI